MRILTFILAGGQSQRMGRSNKAVAMLGDSRLIDLVAARLTAQSGHVMISGPQDFGTDLTYIPDLAAGPPGPKGAIHAISRWLAGNMPDIEGFVTAPVDTPFFPDDLVARLTKDGAPTIAADDNGLHPTFGYWTQEALANAWSGPAGNSLRSLAEHCKAVHCHWPSSDRFLNINTPEDLDRARNRLSNAKKAEL